MDNLLSEYETLYQQAQVLVFFLGFFVCLSLVLVGLLFQKQKNTPIPPMSQDPWVRKWVTRFNDEELN